MCATVWAIALQVRGLRTCLVVLQRLLRPAGAAASVGLIPPGQLRFSILAFWPRTTQVSCCSDGYKPVVTHSSSIDDRDSGSGSPAGTRFTRFTPVMPRVMMVHTANNQ
jgi:hypothetical protein